MDAQKRKQAEIAGGASNIASRRYHQTRDTVVRKLKVIFDDVPNAPEPTPNEMAELRDRYVEQKALNEHSEKMWKLAKGLDPSGEPPFAVTVLKAIYRLTLFAAAVTILYRAFVAS